MALGRLRVVIGEFPLQHGRRIGLPIPQRPVPDVNSQRMVGNDETENGLLCLRTVNKVKSFC